MVVYPEEVWYTYIDKSDIDEIIFRAPAERPPGRAAAHLGKR